MNRYYSDNARHDKAAIILSAMSPDMVEDIISLINARGRSVITTVFSADDSAAEGVSSRFLAIFSSSYVKNKDFEDVWTGFSTVVLATIRKPSYANDDYQKILEDAYSLPTELAQPLALKINTYDVLGNAETGVLTSLGNSIAEGVRKFLNYWPSILQLGWEIDQTQKYDIDFLYELKMLGQVVNDLDSRTRLMTAQSAIQQSMGLLQTGDPVDDEELEMKVGDVFSKLNAKSLPPGITGNAGKLIMFGKTASILQGKKLIEDSGLSVNPTTKSVEQRQPRNPRLAQIFNKILNMNPSQAVLLGASLGLTPTAIHFLRSRTKSKGLGDIGNANDLYSFISSTYGDNVAKNWMMGDVESVVGEVVSDANSDDSTGDVELDEAIEEMVNTGDVDDYGDVEVGGLIRRIRTKVAKRKAAGRKRRATRSTGRQTRKQAEVDYLMAMKKRGTTPEFYGEEPAYDEPVFEEEAEFEEMPAGNEEDNYNLDDYGF